MKDKEFFDQFVDSEEKRQISIRAPEDALERAEHGRQLIEKITGKKPSMNSYIIGAMEAMYSEIQRRAK